MTDFTKQFSPFLQKMTAENLPAIAIKNFQHHYKNFIKEKTGLIPEAGIRSVQTLFDIASLTDRKQEEMTETGRNHMSKTVNIKLNGGLGTSMGLNSPKSLIKVKSLLSFLDIAVLQNRHLNPDVPLIFMNSFSTRPDTLDALSAHPWLQKRSLAVDFIQHKVPKVDATLLEPASHPENQTLEWCPPGHGDVYAALVSSGMLDQLLKNGYEYAFVSNIDNLGAVIDPAILGYFIENNLNFMMETADRTANDKKGGHLAQVKSGRYVLREIAQCPQNETELQAFQDIQKHRYFNTNNLWIRLPALQRIIAKKKGVMPLPLIWNQKTVDPRDPDSLPVYQLETAMGSAISVFDRAGAIRVPRTRFIPVKNTNDLLAVRSDRYMLTDQFQIIPNPGPKTDDIQIDLDPVYYKFIDAFEKRFSAGPPSLKNCHYLTVQGDFTFGKNLIFTKDTMLINTTGNRFNINDHQRFFGGSLVVTNAIEGTSVRPLHKKVKRTAVIPANKRTGTNQYRKNRPVRTMRAGLMQ
ncbi:MAG: UTP--glucose-1-phosphate uridylyltransferase [Desulfotignum sp.]|jgi:UTP--glucose-1-phosphate uridylyltransferase|nr:UTP--glucose-1-phosphate uridylyltransferase [Desulfotignum sp.]